MFTSSAASVFRSRFDWAKLGLLAVLFALSSCGTHGGPLTDGSDLNQAEQPSITPRVVPMQNPESLGTLPALPSPSSLPRAGSSVDPIFFINGGYPFHHLPRQGLTNSNGVGVLEPDFDQDQSGLLGLAYACYRLSTRGQSNGADSGKLFLQWDVKPLHPHEITLALANHATDRWDFFQYGNLIDFGLNLGDKLPLYEDLDGNITLAVLVGGHGSASLKGVLLGDPVFNCSLSAVPESGQGSLQTKLWTYLDIQGDELAYLDVDFEGDGIWDEQHLDSFDGNHTYTQPGIYHPRLRLNTARGYSTVLETNVYVTHPNNIGPTALLQPSVMSGPAPLSVDLDGSASFDDDQPGSQIIRAEWDLDGDGFYETDTGTDLHNSTTLVRQGANKLRLRVTDNDLAISTVSVTITVDGGWTLDAVPGSQASHYTGLDLEVMPASGKAAIAYTPDNPLKKVQYVPSLDVDANGWDQHQFVLVEDGDQAEAKLCEVDGRPALVYSRLGGDPDYSLRYIRAENAAGSSWPASSVQLADFSIGYTDFAVVDGKPAVAFSATQSEAGLHWFRANDAQGASWQPAVQLIDSNFVDSVGEPTILAEPGSPARIIVGSYRSFDEAVTLLYSASDLAASSFGSPETIWDNQSLRQSVMHCSGQYMLLMQGGQPDNNGVNYMALPSLDETAGSYAIVKDDESASGAIVQLATIEGTPLMVYSHVEFINGAGESEIVMRLANDPGAASWSEPMVLSPLDESLQHARMATLGNGLPLLVCSDATNNRLVALRWSAP